MKNVVRSALCAVMILSLILLCACDASKPVSSSFQAMDTVMSLKVYGNSGEICDELKSNILTLDSLFDVTDSDSEISRLNADKKADVSRQTAQLLGKALLMCKCLDGYFDITVYPAVREWGFTTGEYKVPDGDTLRALADRIDYRSVYSDGSAVTLGADTMLDLGAVAKGYAADTCLRILQDSGAQAAVLNLGGTIALYGEKPDGSRFKVGVADPDNPAGYFGYLSLDEGVVSTSGGYERYFVADDGTIYIHILDPKTAAPADNGILSVTVAAGDGTAADALSTALFVMGPDKAAEFYRSDKNFDFIILTDEGELYITEGIYDDFTLGSGYDFDMHKVN